MLCVQHYCNKIILIQQTARFLLSYLFHEIFTILEWSDSDFFSILWVNCTLQILGNVIFFSVQVAWLRAQGGSGQVFPTAFPFFSEWGGRAEGGAETEEPLSADGQQDLGSVYMPLDCTIEMCVLFSFIFLVTEQQDTIITGTWENKFFILSVCSERRPISCWQPLPCRLILGTSKGINTMENTLIQRLTSHLG